METTVESPMISVESPLNLAQPPVKRIGNPITPETAKEYARRSAEARARIAQERKDVNKAQAIIAEAKALSDPNSEEGYRLERLIRTRKQLSQLDEQLEGETDPKAVKAICDAIARLAEVERILAGRPLPGSHRPSNKPSKPKTGQDYGPVE